MGEYSCDATARSKRSTLASVRTCTFARCEISTRPCAAKGQPSATGEDGIRSLAIGLAVQESVRSGQLRLCPRCMTMMSDESLV